ncbi:Ig-like domain-containing protein [Streptomyces sp. Ag109_G2-15]|uniref:Ig-like domain-containing protein n=1 Tax=Streptomyces sp. Ag109_G2-15 TaxID=1938850 RepID=UPI000BD2355C|nr:Ig-like domain-containing protein [Streptomyces sp. Ag109_G2-15]SOD83358.1 Glycine rich protein [Streptomyces sp. Ag109_G2-15]
MSLLRTTLLPAVGAAGLVAAVLAPLPAGAAVPADPADSSTAAPASPCGTGGLFTTAPPTCTYSTAGRTDTFTVPDGVDAISVDLYGAEGGSAAGFVAPNPPNTGAPGGLGGKSQARLAVTGDQKLQVTVGAAGIPGTSRHGEFARPGGFGHGSGGGGAHGGGGSGGGASDVRVGDFGAADRVLVAGGGGGAGNGGPLLHGGDGGGPVGQDGGQGGGPDGSGIAGGGGSRTTPGTGSPNSALGGPGGAASDTDPNTGLPNPGSGGTGGNGARGGNGGGGGGGGYFGGGGGSGGGNPGNLYGAGGGGGSGYATPAASEVSLLQGVNHGTGKAVVSFRYGTTVSLATDTSTPLFGHPVTLTATAAPANPAAGTPSGTVTFSDGTTPLATVPLEAGRARFTTGGLRPGAHALTATYSGDESFTPSATDGPTDLTVGFSRPCITTAHHGALTVPADQAICIGPGGSQDGKVTVQTGGSLAVSDARITGAVTADGALALAVCRSTLTGPLTVRHSTGYVRIGGDATTCAGNVIRGPLTLDANTGGIGAGGNTVTGAVSITGNSGSGPLPDEGTPTFEDNQVNGPLSCDGNEPALNQSDNTVTGPRSGQCR